MSVIMTDVYTSSSSRITKWDGEEANWSCWKTEFKAWLGTQSCDDLMSWTAAIPKDDETLDETADALKIKVKAQNRKAYQGLVFPKTHIS